jgi:hypothetical protein
VPYSLDYDKTCVLPYLRNHEGLSRQGRLVLFRTLREYLGENGDEFRKDESLRRWGKEAPCFEFQLLLGDPDNPGSLKVFRFVVNDAGAGYGVLRIVFVDDQSLPP